jgi:riboflavin kinase/FMN adenylyltransferase
MAVPHKHPVLSGIYIVQVHGLETEPLAGVASIGMRPTVDDSGRVLLETHLFDYAQQCYGRLVRVEFLKKLRDEEKYVDLPTLTAAIERDAVQARTYFRQIADSATSATDRI